MRRLFVFALALASGAGTAFAADSASGSGALALAALVGLQSPLLTPSAKKALSHMLGGDLSFPFPQNGTITVKAGSISCRASDVDISAHDCTLKFGGATRTLEGRAAHELYATLVENGVASDGAAGSVFEAVYHLSCTIKVGEVKERGGGGADCSFDAGPGS